MMSSVHCSPSSTKKGSLLEFQWDSMDEIVFMEDDGHSSHDRAVHRLVCCSDGK